MGSAREIPGFMIDGAPEWASASGAHMTDTRGRRMLDLAMGFGTALHGHGVIARDVAAQLTGGDVASGLGDLMGSRVRARAVEALTNFAAPRWGSHGVAADDLRALVLHTGSEAVETALKTALLATGRSRIVSMTGAYHGTFGLALAVSHRDAFRAPFAAQYGSEVRFEQFGTVPVLTEDDACVIVEPVQGRAGIIEAPAGWLDELRAACDAVGALLILDDVLVGVGRSGVGLEGADCAPDIVCLGKALGGGFAASAVITTAAVAERAWGASNPLAHIDGGEVIHTSTLVGDATSSLAIIATLERHDQAALDAAGAAWLTALREAADHIRWDLRGRGLMWALDSGRDGEGFAAAMTLMQSHGIITIPSGTNSRALTLLPSLACTDEDRAHTVRALVELHGLMA